MADRKRRKGGPSSSIASWDQEHVTTGVSDWDVPVHTIDDNWDVGPDSGDIDGDSHEEPDPLDATPLQAVAEFIAVLTEMYLCNQMKATQFCILSFWASLLQGRFWVSFVRHEDIPWRLFNK